MVRVGGGVPVYWMTAFHCSYPSNQGACQFINTATRKHCIHSFNGHMFFVDRIKLPKEAP